MRYELLKDLLSRQEPEIPDEAKPGVIVEFFDNPCTRVLLYKLFQNADRCMQVIMQSETTTANLEYWRARLKTYEDVLNGIAQWSFEDESSLQDDEDVQTKTWRAMEDLSNE